jgi:hypothetical protein
MPQNLFFLFIIFIIFCFEGCNKKDQAEPDRKALLTAHPWRIKALLYRMKDDVNNSNLTSYVYKDCELDDTYTFGTDSAFQREDNAFTCAILFYFGPYGEGNWMANSDFSQLTISNPGYYSTVFTLDELTEDSFIIEQVTKDRFQDDIVYTYEFEPAQ